MFGRGPRKGRHGPPVHLATLEATGRAGLGTDRAAWILECAGGLHTEPDIRLEFKT